MDVWKYWKSYLPRNRRLLFVFTVTGILGILACSSLDFCPWFKRRGVQRPRLGESVGLFKQLPQYAFASRVNMSPVSQPINRPEIDDVDQGKGHPRLSNFVQSSQASLRHSLEANGEDKEDNDCKLVDKIVQSWPPLMPVNGAVFKSGLDLHQNGSQYLENEAKALLPSVIRKGCGLVAMETERGEKGWIENGVVYRPFRPSNITESYPKREVEAYVPLNYSTFFESGLNVTIDRKKIILWWTKTRYTPKMKGLEPMRSCPEFPCLITTNRRYASDSGAMVFAGQITTGTPPKRRSDQVFIFSNHEPPHQWPKKSPIFQEKMGWKSVFNWTMTYRLDSDVPSLYGLVRLRRVPLHKEYNAIVANKTKFAACIVSNCDTSGKREKYAKELSRYIPIDVYGDCGKLNCPRNTDDECLQMVSTSYKFYLSLESAICTDYISEKFFRYMTADTVVVARASDDFYAHAPPEIFVNTADFDSPKKLAERLLYLAKNDHEYIKILKEKDKYISIFEDYPIRGDNGTVNYMHYHYEAVPFCEICRRLWNLDKYQKTIPDIKKWFNEKLCREPADIML